MTQKFIQRITSGLAATLWFAAGVSLLPLPLHAQNAPTPNVEIASVQQLKSDAFKALRLGKFDVGNDLLARAATASNDPALARMHQWTADFEDQLKTFSDERHKAYDKAVGDVQLLVKNGHADYALDFANRAQLLSDDKKGFHDEPWVHTITADAITRAEGYEQTEQWLKAMRVYADLAAVEPASKEWKERLKTVTRRVRLLALYVPDNLKQIQDQESKERDQVDALIHPVAKATTNPTTHPDDTAVNENFRIDWRETLHDIHMPMLQSAMHDAAVNYYRDINYKDLMLGGLKGLQAIVATRGLDQAFPGLNDAGKRAAFQKYLDNALAAADASTPANEQDLLDGILSDGEDSLLAINQSTIQLPEQVLVSEFADGALGGLDPFSSMIWPSDLEDFNKTTQGEFSGVGIWIKLNDEGDLEVVSPLEDSPAYKAGIKASDVIARINGKSAKGITTNQAVKTITGPAGTTVRLTIRSQDGVSKDYTIRRETIKVASVKGYTHKPGGGWDYYVDPDNKIAYVRITNFTKSTSDELDKAIEEMGSKVNGIIIDLRNNPGGLLAAATDVSDKFLSQGVIVSTRADRETPNPPTIATARHDESEFKKPVVVLVNQYSASASEIVSGCLKDDSRAILVGERTFGKGSVQMLFPLENRSAFLKLTTSHYYLPSGRCIHREENSTEWGVDPDVKVEMTPEQMRDAELARENLDILRDVNSAPAEGQDKKMKDVAAVTESQKAPTTQKATPANGNLLSIDPQLSAALLVLRLEIAGAEL